MIKFYYGTSASTSFQIEPAPKISINTSFAYSNDVITGYQYSVTINGYAMLKDSSEGYRGIQRVLSRVEDIRAILSRNGSDLIVTDNGQTVIKAIGGNIKSLSFDTSDNSWTAFSPFTAEIEFNELNILNDNFTCNNIYINNGSNTSNLVDISKHKIKEFSDSWNLSLDEESFNYMLTSDAAFLPINNSILKLTYNLSATGKNYYINGQLHPAWLQAKIFVQDRLVNRVTNLGNSLKYSPGSACSPSDSLSSIHGNNGQGILKSISPDKYGIFNESVIFNISESDGSFSAQYSCILKENTNSIFSSSNVIHNVTKNVTKTHQGNQTNVKISVNGTIEGLCEGGIVQGLGNYKIPGNNSQKILISANNGIKLSNANQYKNIIIQNNDLYPAFKNALNITPFELGLTNCNVSALEPESFSLTTNYMEGIISYNAEYNTDRCLVKNNNETITNIRISSEEPVPIIAEIIVPNGGYIVQNIGTVSARRITLSATIIKNRICCAISSGNTNIMNIVGSLANQNIESLFSTISFPNSDIYTATSKEYSYNIIDGSYSMTATYICNTSCNINY
jgi:hypothetical protein